MKRRLYRRNSGFFPLIAAVGVAWCLGAASASAQLTRLPIGSTNELREYYLSQVRHVIVSFGPAEDIEAGTNITLWPFQFHPKDMGQLEEFARMSVFTVFRSWNGEGLQSPGRAARHRAALNGRHDVPWALFVTANGEAVFPQKAPRGGAPILFESGFWDGGKFPTNHEFFLAQAGTNWCLPTNVARTLDFPVMAAGGTLDAFIRVPRGKRSQILSERSAHYLKPVTGFYRGTQFEHGYFSMMPSQLESAMAVADPKDYFFLRIPGPMLFRQYGWTVKVWLEDAEGNPLEQDFYSTGEIKKTWHLKPGFFGHQ
jgi:hypothetical protein